MRLEIRSDDPAVARAVSSRLALAPDGDGEHADVVVDYRVARFGSLEAARGRPVYDPPSGCVVYDDETGTLAIDYPPVAQVRAAPAGGAVSIHVDPAARGDLWLLSRPLLTLPLVELLKRRGVYSVHAAAVVLDGRAVVAAGATGSGKSTLCAALLRAGFSYLSDDLVLLRGRSVDGLPDELDVTPSTAPFFPELGDLAGASPEPGWRKHRVDARERFGCALARPAAPAVLLFPEVAPSGTTALEQVGPEEAVLELAPNVLLTEPVSSQAHLDALAELVEGSRTYRIRVGTDWDVLAALVRELVRA